MKRIMAAVDPYETFWDLHESGYEVGTKLEGIINDLGYYEDFFPEEGDPTATDDQYEEVLDIYRGKGGSIDTYSEDDVLEKVMDACYDLGDVRSFEDAGLLTNNKGFVLTINGQQYQFELLGSF